MIFAAPVNLGAEAEYAGVKEIKQLLQAISERLGTAKYDPFKINSATKLDGRVDSSTVWATYLIVSDGVVQIPVLGPLLSKIFSALGSVGYGAFKTAYLGVKGYGLQKWIDPEYGNLASKIAPALRLALSKLPAAGSTSTVPMSVYQQVARRGYRLTSYPAGTFAIRDPGKNAYRIFTPIV